MTKYRSLNLHNTASKTLYAGRWSPQEGYSTVPNTDQVAPGAVGTFTRDDGTYYWLQPTPVEKWSPIPHYAVVISKENDGMTFDMNAVDSTRQSCPSDAYTCGDGKYCGSNRLCYCAECSDSKPCTSSKDYCADGQCQQGNKVTLCNCDPENQPVQVTCPIDQQPCFTDGSFSLDVAPGGVGVQYVYPSTTTLGFDFGGSNDSTIDFTGESSPYIRWDGSQFMLTKDDCTCDPPEDPEDPNSGDEDPPPDDTDTDTDDDDDGDGDGDGDGDDPPLPPVDDDNGSDPGRSRLWLWIILGVVIVFLGAVIAFYLFSTRDR